MITHDSDTEYFVFTGNRQYFDETPGFAIGQGTDEVLGRDAAGLSED